MTIIEYPTMDMFFELPLVASKLVTPNTLHTRVHDDYDTIDERLEVQVVQTTPKTEYICIDGPVTKGLRFRNYFGGGASLPIHNALKVLAYASIHHEHPIIPGLERPPLPLRTTRKLIQNMLDAVIVLPSDDVLREYKCGPHYFFPSINCISVGISVDSDTHMVVSPNVAAEALRETEHQYWNPEPSMFCIGISANCTRAVYNALILLCCAVEACNKTKTA